MNSVGIIGFGAFGQLAAKHLRSDFSIVATDVSDAEGKRSEAEQLGVALASLDEVCKSDIVFLCVPISAMEPLLKEIGPLLGPGTLVIDTCSVKTIPCQQMQSILPASVEIIGSHPLFGPQSAAKGIKGLSVMLCPVRSARTESVEHFLKSLGLNVILTTPKEHDIWMARTQALTHFALKSMERAGSFTEGLPEGTKSFEMLKEAYELIQCDSDQLFKEMQNTNPFAGEARKRLIQELEELDKQLK